MPKRALITGITGQDGSYLAELLLSKGYEVHGIIRRSSSFNTSRIDDIYQDPHETGVRLKLHYGDLNDASSLNRILRTVEPDEIYNLGAQSHVRVSFDVPEYTAEITGLGTVRLLEAIRESGLTTRPRFYQASSSELFGNSPAPQSESTPFHPRSPYAVAKLYAYWIVVNFREAYGLYACNGILFNHECIAASTPLVVRRDGIVDVVTPDELVSVARKGRSVQSFTPEGVDVWDGAGWTAVRAVTATRRRATDPDHCLLSIEARGGVVEVTSHHHMLDADMQPLRGDAVREGGRLALARHFPPLPEWTVLTPEMAEFLGLMASEGYVPERGTLQFTNNDPALRERVADLWRRLFLGSCREGHYPSGFDPSRTVTQLYLTGGRTLCEWLREQLYTADGYKRVPSLVLNSPAPIRRAFLDGYYEGDGLKASGGDGFKTNSAVLAQGLCWLYAAEGRTASVYVEHREGRDYYQVNLGTATPRGDKGQHLRMDAAEVRRIVGRRDGEESGPREQWVFDLETASGRFMAGVGRVVVHNSPRRGETFVSRKITRAAARIKCGLQDRLYLGNLDAKRDWGFAGDYVEAMWLMLQQDSPDDYVIATGECHTVRDFLDEAFGHLGLDWQRHVEIDPRYFRPSEVDELRGDMSRAERQLGWRPKVRFRELVRMMVDADLADVERGGGGHPSARHASG